MDRGVFAVEQELEAILSNVVSQREGRGTTLPVVALSESLTISEPLTGSGLADACLPADRVGGNHGSYSVSARGL